MAPTADFADEYWSAAADFASCSLTDATDEMDSIAPWVGVANTLPVAPITDEYCDPAALIATLYLSLAVFKEPE